MGIVGRICGRMIKGMVILTGYVYLNYRLAGGPPITKVYKEVKAQRKAEEIRKVRREGNVVYVDDWQVV